MSRPVGAPRVLVTRARSDADALCGALAQAGLQVVHVPLVERVFDRAAVANVAQGGHDGWVLTSAAAVHALAGVARRPTWIAVVGPATARAAERAGLVVDLVPDIATAQDLATALGDRHGQRVLYPRAAVTSPGTLQALQATGAIVDDVVAYTNVEPEGTAEALEAAWPIDVVTALSGSAVRRLAAHRPAPWPEGTRLVVIGPRTADVARDIGLNVHAQADPHTVQGVVAAVVELLRG